METLAYGFRPEFRMGHVFGQTLEAITARPAFFLGLALIVSGLPQALMAFWTSNIPAPITGDPHSIGFVASHAGWVLLVNLVLSSLLTCALTRGAIEFFGGREPHIADCLATTAQMLVPAIVIALLVGIGAGLASLLLIVPGVILWLGWSLAIPVLVQERLGVLGSMSRSRELARGHKWALLGLFLCLGVGVIMLQYVIGTINLVVPTFVAAIISGGLAAVAAALTATLQAASYVELRRVVDGTDVNELAEIFA